MKLLVAITLASVITCSGEPPVNKAIRPTENVSFTVASTYGGTLSPFGEELEAAAHPDYAGLMSEVAEGSEKALATFFEVSKNSRFDAASAEAHLSTMRRVLLHWGDLGFSKVLLKQDLEAREKVARRLNSLDDSFRLLFPLTYTASTGKDSSIPLIENRGE